MNPTEDTEYLDTFEALKLHQDFWDEVESVLNSNGSPAELSELCNLWTLSIVSARDPSLANRWKEAADAAEADLRGLMRELRAQKTREVTS